MAGSKQVTFLLTFWHPGKVRLHATRSSTVKIPAQCLLAQIPSMPSVRGGTMTTRLTADQTRAALKVPCHSSVTILRSRTHRGQTVQLAHLSRFSTLPAELSHERHLNIKCLKWQSDPGCQKQDSGVGREGQRLVKGQFFPHGKTPSSFEAELASILSSLGLLPSSRILKIDLHLTFKTVLDPTLF